ncbi:HNH endonuclease [Paenibacillus sp. IITD108]|uniref:HNH endonuclease n=1 Tax=Paenibacillus sp. IITD108 TaxID=3116649 RepID=UPI002F42B14C
MKRRMLVSVFTLLLALVLGVLPVFATPSNESVQSRDHLDLAESLNLSAGSYEELGSDPNASRDTYYYIEYSSEQNSINPLKSDELNVTVVPSNEHHKFIENKEKKYLYEKNTLSVSPKNAGGILVVVSLDTEAFPRIVSEAKVISIIGDKPKGLEFHTTFYSSDTRKFSGSAKSSSFKKEFWKSEVKVGATAKHYYSVSETGFYYSVAKLKILDGTIIVLPVAEYDFLSNMMLLNSKGVPYPYYYDPYASRIMHEPASASLPKGYNPNVKWTTTEREAFKDAYNKTYPLNTINWAGEYTEVHHIKPRNRYGDNSFYNLMPLPKAFHRSAVNPWWLAY